MTQYATREQPTGLFLAAANTAKHDRWPLCFAVLFWLGSAAAGWSLILGFMLGAFS